MNVRELTTKFGLDVDSAAFDRADHMVDGLKHGLTEAHSRSLRLAQGMSRLGRQMTLFVTAPIAALGVGLVKIASDAGETSAKFDAVFKDLAKETRGWIDQVSKDLGRSKIDLEDWLSRLQDTFVPLGFARKEAAGMSKQLTSLAMDLAAFNNASEPETIQLLTSAMVGNHEAVRRFGIVITEATLKAELLNMGIKGGTQKATEQQKAQARLNLIMKMSSDALGQAKREAKGFANQLRALKGGAKDLGAEFGAYLLPIALRVVKWPRSAVDWFKNLSAGTKKFIMIMAGVVGILGPVLLVFGLLGTALINARISWLAYSVAARAAGNASLIAQAKIFLIPLAILAAIAAVVLLINEIYGWVKGYNSILGDLIGPWEEWAKYLMPLFEDIGRIFGGIWKIIKGFFVGLYGLFTGNWELAKQGILIWEGFKEAAGAIFMVLFRLLAWTMGLIVKAVVGAFKAMGRAVWDAAKSILNYLKNLLTPDWLVSAWEWFVIKIEAIWKAIKNIFWGAIGVIVGLFTGDWSLMADGAALIWYGFKGVIRTIWESIKEIFGKAVAWVGKTLEGIMPDFILEAWEWVTTRLAGIWETVKGIFGSAVEFISALLVGDFGAAWNALVEMAEGVLNFFIQWGDLFSDAFLGLFDSLIDGLKSVWDWIGNKIAPMVDGIIDAAKWVADKLGLGGEPTTRENIANAADEANRMFSASSAGGSPGIHGAIRNEVTNRLNSSRADFQTKIEVKVEPGTPDQQRRDIGAQVREAVKEANAQAIRQLQANTAVYE